MDKPTKNMAASVRQRLLNLSRSGDKIFEVVLVSYGLERLIYRLSISAYCDQFILKGGMLVTLWTKDPNRVTRDVDFLSHGDNSEATMRRVFTDIMEIECDDGLRFDTGKLVSAVIKEDARYEGIRMKTTAFLDNTRIPIIVDVGFGDAVPKEVLKIDYPSLLDFPAAQIRAYSPASVISEKFHAIVALGLVNSRMKDYYDLWSISSSLIVKDSDLDDALWATFRRRETQIPGEIPPGLSEEFYSDALKQQQWSAYTGGIDKEDLDFAKVLNSIWTFLAPSCYRLLAKT